MKNKRNVYKIVYIALALLICVIPFACMTFARTDTTTENKRLKEFPALKTEEGFNVDFLSDLGAYFEDRFAFRNQIVAADGVTQGLFGVSTAEGVIKGTDGWLYYTSSAPDYQRLNVFTDREAKNAANNLRLTQAYVESRGAAFALAVAPNKNSLYPEHMPYYYPAGAGETSMEKLAPLLEAYGVNCADLFALFRAQEETLYLMRDSHWNNKGALLAYNAIADAAGMAHETYENAPVTRKKDAVGDLGKMAYAAAAAPEWNYYYDIGESYTYTTPTKSVEDSLIITENEGGAGTLLMFRDSFGNTLLPFFAQNAGKAVFTKAVPYLLDLYMGLHAPDTVIAEKVERNLADFAKNPPVFPAPAAALAQTPAVAEGGFTVTAEPTEYDTRFTAVSGTLRTALDYDAVYAVIGGAAYEAFTVTSDAGDNGFLAYLPRGAAEGAEIEIRILADGQLYTLSAAADTQEDAK